MITQHPDISTLMAFSAGTLDEPYALVISTHVAMCEACQEGVRRTDRIGGAALSGEAGVAMSDGARLRLLAALDADDAIVVKSPVEVSEMPVPLRRYLPYGLSSIRWRANGPGVATRDLPVSPGVKSRLMLLKVAAGRRVPEHSHGGQELTLILQGAYKDRFGIFATGDIADHDEDVEHQPIAEPGEDCICLVAVDAKLNFRSRLIRLLQPLFGM
ncbi:MAG: transcriptional regulator [Devosia sp.]|nr:transcriptional regulator [Devosia sp.]